MNNIWRKDSYFRLYESRLLWKFGFCFHISTVYPDFFIVTFCIYRENLCYNFCRV